MKRFYLVLAVALIILPGCLKKDQTHVVVVPAYGIVGESNEQYKAYIDDVVEYVNYKKNDVDAVIFTGTYSALKDTSEAAVMENYFNTVVDKNDLTARNVQVWRDDCSLMLWQSVTNAKKLLATKGMTPQKVTIFGDTQDHEKILAYGLYQFNGEEGLPTSPVDLVKYAKNPKLVVINFEEHVFDLPSTANAQSTVEQIIQVFKTGEGATALKNTIAEKASNVNFDVAQNLVNKGCLDFKSIVE
ncbi:MAG: hypothetical protein HYV32_05845 [Candidatus Kerfeldbacteria bacterium]|nr:hypothetical protein [Candidatus Kerfeldbacteria bacterium]